MKCWIWIFNQNPLGNLCQQELISVLRASNFSTLCDQYGLDRSLIQPALANLDISTSQNVQLPCFLLFYQPKAQPPLIINRWGVDSTVSKQNMFKIKAEAPKTIRTQLETSRELFTIELTNSQLRDIGLLLAYELARYLAAQGDGLVYGLDKLWYRLNTHQAFIPLGRNNLERA